jgi:hypothetical protein
VHAGEVREDGRGFYGEAIDVAIRLLDSRSVKRALKQSAAPLVLVVSDQIYSCIVCHDCLAADTYAPLRVSVGSRRQRGWVRIPAPAASPVIVRPQRAAVQRVHPAHPRFRAAAIAHKRAVRSGHR